ncbi:hypothetical protein V1511DRAFT_98527 [Dipodascopsis uninucleata]
MSSVMQSTMGQSRAWCVGRKVCRYTAKLLERQKRLSSSATSHSVLPSPRYNLKHLEANSDLYIRSCNLRRLEGVAAKIPEIIECYKGANKLRSSLTDIYTRRKILQLSFSKATTDQRKKLIVDLQEIKKYASNVEEEIVNLETTIAKFMDLVPNILPDNCPTNEEFVVKYLNPSFQHEPSRTANSLLPDYKGVESPKDHVDIGTELGLIDLATASKVSGHAFYYLLGDAVSLELALIQYALSVARRYGFVMAMPPSVVRREFAEACGFRPRDTNGEQQIYNITIADVEGTQPTQLAKASERLCLTGTAEIPLAGYASGEILSSDLCPLKLVGVSRSYRAEAGSRGRDTRGIYRVHEFTKVELFAWTPETDISEESESIYYTKSGAKIPTSVELLENLRELQEEIIGGLGLHARVLDMPASDLGASAFKKYDIEVWMPGRGTWGEVTSASNCTDYQSRRLNTRVKIENQNSIVFAHTLNGTAMAVPRVIVAILENFYDPIRKAVKIPKVLRKFMDDKEWIEIGNNNCKLI